MDTLKKTKIEKIVDTEIYKFTNSFETRYTKEVNNPEGVINSKINNCFVAEARKRIYVLQCFCKKL